MSASTDELTKNGSIPIFRSRVTAPAAVVEAQRKLLAELVEKRAKLTQMLGQLQG